MKLDEFKNSSIEAMKAVQLPMCKKYTPVKMITMGELLKKSERTVIVIVPGPKSAACTKSVKWLFTPGAPGCTSQVSAYKTYQSQFYALKAQILIITSQTTEQQMSFQAEKDVDLTFLSDDTFQLKKILPLSTFYMHEFGMTKSHYSRITLIYDRSVDTFVEVFDKIDTPAKNAEETLEKLKKLYEGGDPFIQRNTSMSPLLNKS